MVDTASEEQVNLLKESVSVWNKWREENAGTIPQLYRADLSRAILKGANLSEANLEEADLSGANLQGANLCKSNLQRANLLSADLQGASLLSANLRSANLLSANLMGASLQFGDLKGAVFHQANLEGAIICRCDLEGADLSSANLMGSNLSMSILTGADLTLANLQRADLHGSELLRAKLGAANLEGAMLLLVRNLVLDYTLVRHAHFDVRAPDPWSTLRRTYSGPRFIINLLALILFVVPYLAKVLFWSSINRVQAFTKTVAETQLVEPILDSETAENMYLCLAEKCNEMPVWQLMLGVDKEWGFWLLACALITYNIVRGWLTFHVAPMRDAEERSGYSPGWIAERGGTGRRWWHGYRHLFWAHHYIAQPLFFIAIGAFVFNAWHWLSQPVWIPG